MNNTPLEIEYKFLILMPDLQVLRKQCDYKEKKLCQMYLELPAGYSPHGSRCRIRKTEVDGKITYFKTFKKDLDGIRRIEIEEEISEAEFNTLSRYRASDTVPIEKTRHTFTFAGYTCEVDVFPFWSDRAFLEIEVENETTVPAVPSFIEIIKDVSTDKNFRNSVLAKRIFDGSIT